MGLFTDLQKDLVVLIGNGEKLSSGNGIRYRLKGKGVLTAYSRDIADGNLAELAFEEKELSFISGLSEDELLRQIDQLRLETGQPVKINPTHKWPRVGLSTSHHVSLVVKALSRWLPKS
ncbi:hypothetical protein [Pseudomonas sp. RIT-PI-AD]|uniref:hypothetical protein n=1 Tax=Pseudomonas sp. RIT-PI-AD TaxID=3035294 RepID=UPI0021DA7FFF|nr:hypothetical protein [Pseudomonas sp. RIT-PI-AD]